MTIRFEPLQAWIRPPTKPRRHSRFRVDYTAKLDALKKEIGEVRGRNTLILLAIEQSEIRNDGLPYARAKPSHPGVVLQFEKWMKGGYQRLQFACDTYLDWRDNLYAIAKFLERLRLLDLDGVAQNDEAYLGFAALPPPPEKPTPASAQASQSASLDYYPIPDGVTEPQWKAAIFLATIGAGLQAGQRAGRDTLLIILKSRQEAERMFREAAKRCHPDAGGDDWTMQKLNEARAILKARHGL